ncbi:MAG: outer membrane protein assembly factor BamA [Clostridia bacterium]
MRRGVAAVLAACALAAASAAWAQSFAPFTVRDIRVEGLQRTEAGTVFSYLPVKVGETMNEEKAQQALRALFATGFFQDVRLEVDKDVLVVIVQERPAIAQIDLSGNKEFANEVLTKALREMGLAEGRIFDRSLLETASQEIKRQYLTRGMYATDVQTTVTPLERNRVGLNIAITEGEVAKIRGINIVGTQAFTEKELVNQMTLRTPGWLTWYTKHDRYARDKLSADLETLRSFYQNRGYLDFNIESTQVSITPDRQDIYLTINISEGEKYTVSSIDLGGQMLVPKEELEKLIQLKPGDVFSREKLAKSTKAISDRLGNDGYAFANANAVPDVDKEKHTVAFTIVVDPGRRVYVRRINVVGNNKTRDEVVRRELRQLEGAFYDASRIQLSKRRIDRTQYFDAVDVETQPVEGSPDQVDVNYAVKEKPTGALLLGAGFSTVEKLILQASISQSNVFGTGKFVSANVSSGSINKVYSLSYLDPYFTVDGVSQGFDVYKRKTDASLLAIGPYATDSVGGGVKFGYPISETIGVNFGLALESTKLTTFDTSPTQYINFVNQFGNDYSYATFSAGWGRDTRDSAIRPTDGSITRVSGEVAQGNLQFYRTTFQHQTLFPLSREYAFSLRGELGYAGGLSGRPLPFFKNYYAGGPDSVRGYRAFSLGPRDPNNLALGGNRKVVGSAEFLFPVPGADKEPSLRLAAFLDAGQVYDGKIQLSDLRYSTGVGLSWSSPFGPLRLSFGFPVHKREGDDVQRLQFTFGTVF